MVQIVFASMDLELHGRRGGQSESNTEIAARVIDRFSSFPYVSGTHPQTKFQHLVGYGASYYSYLYAPCLASALWESNFVDDPLNRSAGAGSNPTDSLASPLFCCFCS